MPESTAPKSPAAAAKVPNTTSSAKRSKPRIEPEESNRTEPEAAIRARHDEPVGRSPVSIPRTSPEESARSEVSPEATIKSTAIPGSRSATSPEKRMNTAEMNEVSKGDETAELGKLIGYPGIDLIDRPPVDETLIKLIENGGYELTDERFFQLLGESAAYLGCGPFQERIFQWQHVMRSALYEADERQAARSKLEKIGSVLARDGAERGRPDKFNEAKILFRYAEAVRLVERFLAGDAAAKKGMAQIQTELKKTRKKLITTGRRSAIEIAVDIIVKREGISERQLRKILKESARWKQQVIQEGFVPSSE